jgi:hypothetical protein
MKPTAIANFRNFVLLSLIVICPPVNATDYSSFITEDYLRSQFSFGDGDTLKYSQCEKKSYPTCTYIWGPESEKDAARINAGLAPAGSKLQIVYAQAASINNFDRVLSAYTDAESVDGIGETAVWSDKRKQLSFITETNLIVHVNIAETQGKDPEAKAVAIANDLIEQF